MAENYLKQDFYNYLKSNDALLDTIINSNKKYFFVLDLENKENVWLSSSIWRKLGFKDDKHEHDLQFWEGKFQLNSGTTFEIDVINDLYPNINLELITKNGEKITTNVTVNTIKNKDNKVTRVCGILDNNWNNLDLNYSMQQFEILINLYKSSYRNYETVEALYAEITNAICKGLNISRAGIWQSEEENLVCKMLFDSKIGILNSNVTLSKNDFPIYFSSLQECLALVTNDAQTDYATSELKENYLVPTNIKSMLDIPIRENGKLIGIVCCENVDTIRNWSTNDIAFARSIADIYCLFKEEINKIKAENELTEYQERIAFIVDNISDGIYIIENDKMVFKSPRYLEMIGRSSEQKDLEHNQDVYHLVHEEDKLTIKNNIHSAIRNKLDSVRHVFRCFKDNGEYMWREDIMNIQYNSTGNAFRAVTIARDVTEEKNKEIDLKIKNKAAIIQNKLLLQLFADTYNLSLKKIVPIVTKIATQGLEIDRASYWYIENQTIVCKDLFDTYTNSHTSGAILEINKIPNYFEAISSTTELIIEDVLTHIATSELVNNYLIPEQITKLLDIPVRENGKIVGIMCFEKRQNKGSWSDNDITFSRSLADFLSIKFAEDKQKKIEEKLFENEKQLTLITQNTTDGIYVIENNVITYLSPAFKQLLKHIREDDKNFTIEDMFNNIHPEDQDRIKKTIYTALKQRKEVFKYELRVKGANKKYHWREDSINVIYDVNGDYSKYIVITREISARKKSEIEKKRLYEITEKQNDRLINFTHIVSHDIRSHTSNMSMILDLYEDTNDETEKEEYFSMLKESTFKLSETIYFLNETVAIQNGLKKEKLFVNLKDAVKKSILGISAIIKTNKAIITINIDPSIEILVTPSYLESILFNLINNAIKYQSPSRKPKITIFTNQIGDYIQLNISDNGQGIDLVKYQDKIFGMYKTFHGNADAVGLGLFMVKNQIEAMGGKIEVDSQIDRGTIFKLYFIWKEKYH